MTAVYTCMFVFSINTSVCFTFLWIRYSSTAASYTVEQSGRPTDANRTPMKTVVLYLCVNPMTILSNSFFIIIFFFFLIERTTRTPEDLWIDFDDTYMLNPFFNTNINGIYRSCRCPLLTFGKQYFVVYIY